MGHRMTRSEIDSIVSEVGTCPVGNDGESHCVIPVDQMLHLMSRSFNRAQHRNVQQSGGYEMA